MTEELKLLEPTFWVAAPPRGGLVLTEVRPSAWAAHPVYTADQMRAAILAERERLCQRLEDILVGVGTSKGDREYIMERIKQCPK